MAATDANKLRSLAAAVGVGSLALFGVTACDTEEDTADAPAEEENGTVDEPAEEPVQEDPAQEDPAEGPGAEDPAQEEDPAEDPADEGAWTTAKRMTTQGSDAPLVLAA